jgi:hypothetical protein
MTYSKAFEKLVLEDDDVVGLLAYALYKQTINENVCNGKTGVIPEDRDPQPKEVKLYRDQAESYLRTFAQVAIDKERANIISSALPESIAVVTGRLVQAENNIVGYIKSATGFWWPGVGIGIVAWLISLAITVLVVSQAPEWSYGLIKHDGLSQHTEKTVSSPTH